MSKTALNDFEYNFEPLKEIQLDPNYKVDKQELEISIKKNKEIIRKTNEYRDRHVLL